MHEWEDKTPEFHNILSKEYMERVSVLLDEYRKTLRPGNCLLYYLLIYFYE